MESPPSWTDTAKDVGLIAIAAWGALTAHRGLRTWKQQLHGTAGYELARNLLRSVYQMRDAVRDCRRRTISGSEIRAALDSNEQPSLAALAANERVAYLPRWERVADAMATLDTQLFEAEVLWGAVYRERAEEIRPLVRKLKGGLFDYLELMSDDDLARRVPGQLDTARDVAVAPAENDVFGAEIDDALEKVGDLCKDHLPRG